ncbi:DUF637 domain-containing protein [Curvivirga aplysinae]|uniref:DUF637 domain-containing protein n=1 Tax=Curvivirga aplysinae TaxID=2529852 RepID=UPI001C3F9197|nr:DUF637 domain-containing protein [Curvivirga aplysinae]
MSQFSFYVSLHTSIKAGEEISLKARKDLELVGSKLEAGEDIFLEATEGGIRLLTARDSTFESLEKNYEGKAWFKMHSQGEIAETVSMVLMEAQGSINFKSAEGITVEYRESGNLLEDAAALSKLPGLEWMEEALERDDIDWVAVQEHYESWDEKNEGMTGAAMAVVAIAVAVVTAGTGLAAAVSTAASSAATGAGASAAVAAGVGAAAKAAVISSLTQLTVGTINGKGNIFDGIKHTVSREGLESIVMSALTAALTAGITSAAGVEATGNAAGGATATDFDFTDLNSIQDTVKNQLISAAVKASVNTAFGNGELGDNLKSALVTAAVNVASSQIYQAIGDFAAGKFNDDLGLGDGFKLEDGSVEKILLHAVAGCGIGEARSGGCFAGAIGAGLQEALGDTYEAITSDKQNQAQLAGLVAAVAVALSGGDADAVNTANATAYDANLYNRQLHTEEIQAIQKEATRLANEEGATRNAAQWEALLIQAALSEVDGQWASTLLEADPEALAIIGRMAAENSDFDVTVAGKTIAFLQRDDFYLNSSLFADHIRTNAAVYDNALSDWTPPGYEALKGVIRPSSLALVHSTSIIAQDQRLAVFDPNASDAENELNGLTALVKARLDLREVRDEVNARIADLRSQDNLDATGEAQLRLLERSFSTNLAASQNKILAEVDSYKNTGTLDGVSNAIKGAVLETVDLASDVVASPFSEQAKNDLILRLEGLQAFVKDPTILVDYYTTIQGEIDTARAAGQFEKADRLEAQMITEILSLASGGASLVRGVTVLAKKASDGTIKMVHKVATNKGVPDTWTEIGGSVGAKINAPTGFKSYRTPDGDITHVSPAGLKYGYDKNFGNRVDHVLAHTYPNPNKKNHTVFNAKGDDALALVDEAWSKRGASLPNDSNAFLVNMGRAVGTAGETSIRVVVDPKTNNIITAYPQ